MFFTSGLVSVLELLSLSSGVMASEEVDCYKAYKVGSILLSKYQRYMKYSEVKFKKSGCIKNMTFLSTIKVCNENRNVDPLILFERMLILKKSDDELK